jgi:Na+-driven multidrug efflux pump
MGRHAYDRTVVPPFNPDLGAAVVARARRMLLGSAVGAAVEVLLVGVTALLGPPNVRWWVGIGGKGGGTVLWDEVLPTAELVLLVLLLTLPGLAVTALSTAGLVRRVRRRVAFRRAPRGALVGVVLTHALAPSLAVAGLVSWAEWGEVGSAVAGLLPQLGTSALGIVLLMSHEHVDPWAWADPTSRRGRRARERWARRVERARARRARAGRAEAEGARTARAAHDSEPACD